ncbi:GldG family protein [candidate division KSB1 bacterium]|nr:GldG family protein [candidate division KSB1 bacterium]
MKKLGTYLGAFGVLLLALGGGSYYLRATWTWFEYATLGLGGALALLYLALNAKEIYAAFTQRGALQTANAVLMTSLVFALLGLVVFLSDKHGKRFDTTAAQQFSLADQTVKVLQGLQDDLRVTYFYNPQEQDQRYNDLLKEYAAITPKFKHELIDLDRKPDIAREYNVTSYNTTVISYRESSEKISGMSESDLTNAIIKVTREKKKKIYFTTHHGEKDLVSSERMGMNAARLIILEKNYDVAKIALLDSGRVPVDCAALVIAGAETQFLPSEIAMVKKYLKLGGALYLLLDTKSPSFSEILSEYGITAGNDLVLDASGVGQLFGAGANMPVVMNYADHAITRDFGQFMTAYPDARSLTLAQPRPTGIEATAFAQTTPNSWAETKLDAGKGEKMKFDANEDVRGPIALAIAAKRSASSNLGTDQSGEGARDSRLVVFGDADFATNYLFEFQKNGDLFMNALSWLAEEEDLISIRARDPEDRRISLTGTGSRVLLLFSVVLLPLASFLAAIAIYVKRK